MSVWMCDVSDVVCGLTTAGLWAYCALRSQHYLMLCTSYASLPRFLPRTHRPPVSVQNSVTTQVRESTLRRHSVSVEFSFKSLFTVQFIQTMFSYTCINANTKVSGALHAMSM